MKKRLKAQKSTDWESFEMVEYQDLNPKSKAEAERSEGGRVGTYPFIVDSKTGDIVVISIKIMQASTGFDGDSIQGKTELYSGDEVEFQFNRDMKSGSYRHAPRTASKGRRAAFNPEEWLTVSGKIKDDEGLIGKIYRFFQDELGIDSLDAKEFMRDINNGHDTDLQLGSLEESEKAEKFLISMGLKVKSWAKNYGISSKKAAVDEEDIDTLLGMPFKNLFGLIRDETDPEEDVGFEENGKSADWKDEDPAYSSIFKDGKIAGWPVRTYFIYSREEMAKVDGDLKKLPYTMDYSHEINFFEKDHSDHLGVVENTPKVSPW